MPWKGLTEVSFSKRAGDGHFAPSILCDDPSQITFVSQTFKEMMTVVAVGAQKAHESCWNGHECWLADASCIFRSFFFFTLGNMPYESYAIGYEAEKPITGQWKRFSCGSATFVCTGADRMRRLQNKKLKGIPNDHSLGTLLPAALQCFHYERKWPHRV